jgi:ATP-dependent DNA helicase RecG
LLLRPLLSELDNDLILSVAQLREAKQERKNVSLKEDVPTILEKFDLLTNGIPNCAAYVLFGKKLPPYRYLHSVLKFAIFRGTTMREFIDNKRFEGNIFQLMDRATALLMQHLPVAGKITDKSFQRQDTPALPPAAIREALINAFCHRDYGISGGAVYVALFDDRLEISSSGDLPKGVTLEALTRKHRSVPRNRLIANVLYSCGWIENWGRGTLDIIGLCKEHGNKEPIFELHGPALFVTFMFNKPIGSSLPIERSTPLLSQKDLPPLQQEILTVLGSSNLTRAEIASKLKGSPSTRMMQRALLALKLEGLVQNSGHTHKARWFTL